ncbi:MAG: bifunctional enoyl-CoA hydratase/phosphate acetyltransferase [Candidatus Korobacteraceae bacterium]|jgi:phosphate butyryltransferase
MCVTVACTQQETIATFLELRRRAQELGPMRVAVVVADDDVALMAAADALQLGIARPILIGDGQKIWAKAEALGLIDLMDAAELVAASDAAPIAVQMARAGNVDIILKGHLRTDELLRAVLDKTAGLRTGRLLSDVMLYEDVLSGERRLVGLSDGGLNVAPTLEQKKQIVQNAIEVMHSIGLARPRIAIMSASEVVTESMPSTLDAQALSNMGAAGEFGEAEVYGPLALDNALVEAAAKAKGIDSPVAGHADCMLMPNIEAGNLLGKAIKYLGGSQCAHVVVGAKVPILIPSRVESSDDKVNAIALGVIFAAWSTQSAGH